MLETFTDMVPFERGRPFLDRSLIFIAIPINIVSAAPRFITKQLAGLYFHFYFFFLDCPRQPQVARTLDSKIYISKARFCLTKIRGNQFRDKAHATDLCLLNVVFVDSPSSRMCYIFKCLRKKRSTGPNTHPWLSVTAYLLPFLPALS